jgi:hypothetical protein
MAEIDEQRRARLAGIAQQRDEEPAPFAMEGHDPRGWHTGTGAFGRRRRLRKRVRPS